MIKQRSGEISEGGIGTAGAQLSLSPTLFAGLVTFCVVLALIGAAPVSKHAARSRGFQPTSNLAARSRVARPCSTVRPFTSSDANGDGRSAGRRSRLIPVTPRGDSDSNSPDSCRSRRSVAAPGIRIVAVVIIGRRVAAITVIRTAIIPVAGPIAVGAGPRTPTMAAPRKPPAIPRPLAAAPPLPPGWHRQGGDPNGDRPGLREQI